MRKVIVLRNNEYFIDKNKLNGLVCFWCQNLKEAKILSGRHQEKGHKTKIIILDNE